MTAFVVLGLVAIDFVLACIGFRFYLALSNSRQAVSAAQHDAQESWLELKRTQTRCQFLEERLKTVESLAREIIEATE